ncbi:MAG: acyl-CoA thioesterase [Verrucomicrobia bacterium]|nr:MAG: acyl-CoA thioesterase [Verrucomicrobiota bacterium]TAE87502.1 MAG: acyl-CoA thioesterase [Verrucomicrobiota bacterium]TAF25784.1 MAG: acyl-CoA thioesterase [Verrucomicrobiota bacterium]TAF41572.1 MAG: acyl-CoA thioesterase [Verrucomicrobiota bacterium]
MDRPCHIHRTEVAFGDTDCSGWLHFPKIFRHVEEAEHGFLRGRGVMIFDRALGGWPRVHVSCDYKQALRFGDPIEVRLGIDRIGSSSLHWCFEVWRDGECCASGKMSTVRVDATGKAIPIDADTRARLA